MEIVKKKETAMTMKSEYLEQMSNASSVVESVLQDELKFRARETKLREIATIMKEVSIYMALGQGDLVNDAMAKVREIRRNIAELDTASKITVPMTMGHVQNEVMHDLENGSDADNSDVMEIENLCVDMNNDLLMNNIEDPVLDMDNNAQHHVNTSVANVPTEINVIHGLITNIDTQLTFDVGTVLN
jgi:hypothetical protein